MIRDSLKRWVSGAGGGVGGGWGLGAGEGELEPAHKSMERLILELHIGSKWGWGVGGGIAPLATPPPPLDPLLSDGVYKSLSGIHDSDTLGIIT